MSKVLVVDPDFLTWKTAVKLIETTQLADLGGTSASQADTLLVLAEGLGVEEIRVDSTGVGHVLLCQLEDASVKLDVKSFKVVPDAPR